MPQRLYAHVGVHKSGTTYLQNVFRINRRALRKLDVYYPVGRGQPSQALAVADLQGRRLRGQDDVPVAGAWKALVNGINASPLATALISRETLGMSSLRQVKAVVAAFPDADIHAVVTARDLARVLVSMWQEEVKNDQSWTWREYVDAVRDPEAAMTMPALGFWRRADVLRVCDTWAAAVGADHVHVVTVPPQGSQPELLLQRFASVVGFDPAGLPKQPAWSNEMVGAAATEVLRRVNAEMGGRLNQGQHGKAIRNTLVPMLARSTSAMRIGLPAEEFGWVEERSADLVSTLKSRGYDLVGDLDDLAPRREPDARGPEDVSDEELLGTAVSALALLTEEYATTWWSERPTRPEGVGEESTGDLRSRARARLFNAKVKAVSLAQRSKLASKLVRIVARAEDRAIEKERNRS